MKLNNQKLLKISLFVISIMALYFLVNYAYMYFFWDLDFPRPGPLIELLFNRTSDALDSSKGNH